MPAILPMSAITEITDKQRLLSLHFLWLIKIVGLYIYIYISYKGMGQKLISTSIKQNLSRTVA